MSNYPRRSARLSQQQMQHNSHSYSHQPTNLPSYSPSSTVSNSSQPSPVSDPSSFTRQEQEKFRLQTQSQFLAAQSHFPAPLPSPSIGDHPNYFNSQPPYGLFPMSQQSQQSQQSSTQQSSQQTSHRDAGQNKGQQTPHHHSSFSQGSRPPPNVHGNNPSQGQLPPDFLAEAARRAQMACLMRDLGDVTL